VSQFNNSQIIAPPVEEEVYPYRSVWRSIIIQTLMLVLVTIGIVVVNQFISLETDNTITFVTSLIFVILPVILWLLFSVLPERFVDQPRRHLLSIAIISGLVASALGIPLLQDFFQIDQWIPLQSAFQRIAGYTFTVGIIDTGLKFIVLRYIVFPHNIRIRTDAIAFCVASAIGYGFVVNLHVIAVVQPTVSTAIIYVFGNHTMQITSALVLSYGLSQVTFNNSFPILLPIVILISAIVIGMISPLESGLTNGSLTIDGGFTRPIFTVGFLVVMLIIISSIVFFLYTVAERREEEKYVSSRI